MLPNHYVYKGYRLSANLERVLASTDGGLDGVMFRASIQVMRADLSDAPGVEYEVPAFADGAGRHSPREAIDVAVQYGCQVVEAALSSAQISAIIPGGNPPG